MSLEGPDAASRYREGDPATVGAVRTLIRNVLRSHSPELKPYWDDLEAEVCLQAWIRTGDRTQPVQSLEGLVARMTHSRIVDCHRRRSRWRVAADTQDRLSALPDPGLGPYEYLRRAEACRLVNSMISDADERTRAIWKLLYFDGLKYREAAARLGLPEGTLKRLVHESLREAARRFFSLDLSRQPSKGLMIGQRRP